VHHDPAYERDVDPILETLLADAPPGPRLDLGCGDGRLLQRFSSIGVDSSKELVRCADPDRAVVADVVCLPFADRHWAVAYAVLVLEHLGSVTGFFTEAARVTSAGGALVLVINHPIYTAPGSGPFLDPEDGEVLWRWGTYLSPGSTQEPGAGDRVEFHHRSMADLLSEAASAGWDLDRAIERALSPAGDPLLAAQSEVPRLLGVRWIRRTGTGVDG
jgi:SAM-dependent methyltransferase